MSYEPAELIDEVGKYPALYDDTCELYRNSDYNCEIWKKIAKDLNAEGKEEECRKKWTAIRDRLRKVLRRRKPGEVVPPSMKYKYEDHLQFLIPFYSDLNDRRKRRGWIRMNKQKGVSNKLNVEKIIGPTEIYVDDSESQDFTQDCEDRKAKESTSKLSTTPMRITLRNAGHKRKLSNTSLQNQPEEPESPLFHHFDPSVAAEAKEMQHFYKNEHAVDAFLAGIAPSLKMLDSVRLLAAKGKIFNIVQEYELQQLNANNKRNSRIKRTQEKGLDAEDVDIEVLWNSS